MVGGGEWFLLSYYYWDPPEESCPFSRAMLASSEVTCSSPLWSITYCSLQWSRMVFDPPCQNHFFIYTGWKCSLSLSYIIKESRRVKESAEVGRVRLDICQWPLGKEEWSSTIKAFSCNKWTSYRSGTLDMLSGNNYLHEILGNKAYITIYGSRM